MLLRQIEVEIANGKNIPQVCRDAQITTQTFYRWRKEYGGLKGARLARIHENDFSLTKSQAMTSSVSNGREMLKAEEVRDMTGVPVSTLHDWAAKRERGMQAPGPHHIRLSNRHRRWARKDVDRWIESARI